MGARAPMTEGGGPYECGVCWSVYDPALGDPVAQIQPGIAFGALPDGWRCPECAAPRERFLALDRVEGTQARIVRGPAAVADAVRAAFLSVDETMRGLPIHNPRLGIETLGFRRVAGASVGVVVTPWSMILLRVPDAPDATPLGETVRRAFPSGEYDFIVGEMDGLGSIESCSLFSPMDTFDDHAVARTAAAAAITALFASERVAAEPANPEPPPTRRALLLGRRA